MRSVALHYQRNAERLARTYLDVSFEGVHTALLTYLPEPGSRIADVGAGSGRDAYALAARGYVVTAIEPSAAMRRGGQLVGAGQAVEWIDDSLPTLAKVRSTNRVFDFVLCSAVLMHLPFAALSEALHALRAITANGACLAITLRSARRVDPPGVFHSHDTSKVIGLAARAGLNLIETGTNGDLFDRPDAAWTSLVFHAGEVPIGTPP